MRQTVVGVFNRRADAQRAMQVLQDSGFGPDAVHMTEGDEAAADHAATGSEGQRADDDTMTGKVRRFFAGLFEPDDEAEFSQYSDAIRRGCAIVKVDVEEEPRLDAAREALVGAGAINIEEQQATTTSRTTPAAPQSTEESESQSASRSTSLPGSPSAFQSATRSASSPVAGELRSSEDETSTPQARRSETAEEQVIPVVREELQIGKRAVNAGGVRVYVHTEQRPVEETVTLREERAQVERRPVDREATSADLARLQDTTVEVTETVEKPVVQKIARVVEEVAVGKKVEERTEEIQDTVRNTEVEVEPLAGGDAVRRSRAYEDYEDEFRADFGSRYARAGGQYDEYAPAYRYGYSLAGDKRYAGRSWDELESDARRDWETAHPGSAWERFKAAVRHAWERVTT